VAEVVREALDDLAGHADALYVDLDVDVVDSASAPGCPGARPGGLQAWELLDAAAEVGRHPAVVAVDVVEVDAEADPSGRTVDLAAACLLRWPPDWRRGDGLRAVGRDGARVAGAVLGRAFLEDPVWGWLLRGSDRERRLVAAFTAVAGTASRTRGAALLVSGAHTAVALWLPPDGWRPSQLEQVRTAPGLARRCGPAGCCAACACRRR
jgi:hypothetical protein